MSGSTLITSFPQKDQKIISPISRSVVMLPKYIPLLFFLHFPTVKIKFKYYYTHFEENVCMYVCMYENPMDLSLIIGIYKPQ